MSLSLPIVIVLILAAPLEALASGSENLFGLGVLRQSVVPGSRSAENRAIPIVSYSGSRLFVSTLDGIPEAGVHTTAGSLRIGVQLAVEEQLDFSEASEPTFASRSSRSAGISLGAQAVWATHLGPAPLRAMLRSRSRIGAQEGSLIDARFAVGLWRSEWVAAQAHSQLTWGDRRANAQDFGPGVTGGHRETRVGITFAVAPQADWRALAGLERRFLVGDAARAAPKDNSTSVLLALVRTFK